MFDLYKKIFVLFLVFGFIFLLTPRLHAALYDFSGISEELELSVVFIDVNILDKTTGRYIVYKNGSGFIIKKDGLILTAFHVVYCPDDILCKIHITLFKESKKEKKYEALLLGGDNVRDVALLSIKAPVYENFKPIKIGNSNFLKLGEIVAALGYGNPGSSKNPLIILSSLQFIQGSVAAKNFVFSDAFYNHELYLQMMTFPGHSGGPVINKSGEVVGIIVKTISYNDNQIGQTAAIPINDVNIERLKTGIFNIGFVGIIFSDISKSESKWWPEEYKKYKTGVKILDPYNTKLKLNDIVISFNSELIHSTNQFNDLINMHPGQVCNLEVLRGGEIIYVSLYVNIDKSKKRDSKRAR